MVTLDHTIETAKPTLFVLMKASAFKGKFFLKKELQLIGTQTDHTSFNSPRSPSPSMPPLAAAGRHTHEIPLERRDSRGSIKNGIWGKADWDREMELENQLQHHENDKFSENY